MTDFNAGIIAEFRANHGRVAGMFEGAPILLVHSKGARSGADRLHPVVYQKLDIGWAIFASKGGAPTNPDWFHNLRANPNTSIEIGDEAIDVVARVAEGEERERIYNSQAESFPQIVEYQRKTTRKIPVVILEADS